MLNRLQAACGDTGAGPYARLLTFLIPSLSIMFLINKVHPTLFCLQHRSVAGQGVGRKWPGWGTRRKMAAQMTARSIENGGSLGLPECFAEETPCRQEEAIDTVFWREQLMWKKCVLLQYRRCRCKNTCWQVGFSGKMHIYSFSYSSSYFHWQLGLYIIWSM